MGATTIYDELTLKVVLDGKERRIMSSGPDPTKFVSKNGQRFYDGVWRVGLYERDAPSGGRQRMVVIDYHGHNTAKRNRLRKQHFAFGTGLLQMHLKKTKSKSGSVRDEMEIELIEISGS